jgi:N-acetyl-anhydromuramyl-L-alanine amidase AmpD
MEIKRVLAHPGNYTLGRPGGKISGIVLHVMDGTLEGTGAWFQNPKAEVSAHYGVGLSEVHQFVEEQDTAWHAGRWSANVNTIGIEHEGRQVKGQPSWQPTNEQYWLSVNLAADICRRHRLEPGLKTILPHSAFNPLRVNCPGEGFPLLKYIEDVKETLAKLKTTETLYIPLRLFDPKNNQQIGVLTLIRGTDKAYLKEMKGS